jgi:hypothetical protein
MTMIIDGTNGLTFNNSTTQASAGQVLQVVNSPYSTASSTTSTSFVTTGHTGTITPKFSTSKIFVVITGGTGWNGNQVNKNSFFTIYRNGTNLASEALYNTYCNAYASNSISMSFYDSPATTSATTYTVYFKTESGGAINYVSTPGGVSSPIPATMTLIEVAA